ncbi:predicted protein [Nematostella vectensis]|uniref:Alpha-L-arabinofuranosidase B arabinose-binding domain-containing protein n=1 Tax=Nematostella vectensis TaxID=45351 RepID=A7SQS3_NEMVE|nr:predicted protein [Nematostella vectensis]|eukprot:XP_001626038.1 predicted protein [Nematostella vectensis]
MRLMLVLCAVVFASGAAVHETEVQDALPNCVSIISINSPKTRRTLTFDNFGIASNTHGSLLSKHPGQFRIKKGGFLGKKGTVSIESLKNPGYFLRHKNYNFRLERTTKNSMFAKDATFYLLKVQDDPALYAFELYSHPSWFVAHKRTLPYKLTLRHVTGADQHVMDSTFFLEPRKCQTSVQDALPNCVSIISINSPKTRRTLTFDNFGIASNTHGSLLSKHPGQFRIKKGGFLGKKGTVSIESLKNPGYFLRHKNYNFRLERTTKNSMFAKDATFYLLKVQDDPALYAFELYSHPSWFVAHKRTLPYKLTLRHVTGADQHVMDSTFFLEPRKCQTSGKGKDAQTKKATITANDGDSDLTDIDTSDNAKSMGPQGSSGTIVVQNDPTSSGKDQDIITEVEKDPTSSGKDQDIITEVEKAFNSSMSGKSDKVLKALESDIERKVDGLADQVITPKDSASAKNDSAKDPQIDDGSENVVTQTVADFADSSEAVGTESADDVIVHVDSGNKKSMGSRNTGVKSRVNKGEPKYQDKSNEASRSSEVHKGDPKQMDEHLEVISRNKLAKPSVKSAKRDLLTGQATPNKNSADKRTGFARAVELVNEAQSKLKNVLNKLDEKAASTKSGIKPARVATLVENIQKKMKQESAHARHLNISADTLHNLAKQTPAKVCELRINKQTNHTKLEII